MVRVVLARSVPHLHMFFTAEQINCLLERCSNKAEGYRRCISPRNAGLL